MIHDFFTNNTIRPRVAVVVSISLSILSVIISSIWARISVSYFQGIAGQGALAGLANENVAHMWGISLPFFVGTLFICVFSCWMFIIVIRRKATKFWLLGLLPHVIAFITLFWQIVKLEFKAFN